MAGLKWSSFTQSYSRCLIVLLILQTSQILGEESQIVGEDQDKFNIGYTWIRQDIQFGIPANAVQGGYEPEGPAIYVGKVSYKGNSLPAKVIPNYPRADVSYNHTVYSSYKVDVLIRNSGTFEWVGASNGYVPPNAIVAGRTASGEALYAGRTEYNGGQIVGKIQPSDRCLYIAYAREEIMFYAYEVLVYNSDC